MPITKSAKKALRQNQRRKTHNLRYENKIKALFKEARNFIAQKKNNDAKKLLPLIYKVLDKAAKEKIIKKNTASRRKARIAKTIGR